MAIFPRFLKTSSCPPIVPAASMPDSFILSNVRTLLIIDARITSNTFTDNAKVVASMACPLPNLSYNCAARRLYSRSRALSGSPSFNFLLWSFRSFDRSSNSSLTLLAEPADPLAVAAFCMPSVFFSTSYILLSVSSVAQAGTPFKPVIITSSAILSYKIHDKYGYIIY